MGCTAAEIIHLMCVELRKKQYLQELGESFDLMRNDPKKSAGFETEQKFWESTLFDGLDSESVS